MAYVPNCKLLRQNANAQSAMTCTYNKELVEKHHVDITGMDTEEKSRRLRKFREALYEELKDAVYKRRGWTANGIPTLETVTRLGIDFPDVLELLKAHGVE